MLQKGRSRAQLRRIAAIFGASLGCALACMEDVDLGQFQAPATGAGAEAGGSGGTSIALGGADGEAGAGVTVCVAKSCSDNPDNEVVYACGNCLDDDGDGAIDADDSQCLGPCDNTENSFFGGIPGQNNAPCRQDCYFDSDTGPGNDGCYWSHSCDPKSLPDDYPPSGDTQCAYDEAANISGTSASCAALALDQAAECLTNCLPFVPNGCDCFGCCELPAGSGEFVWLGSNNNGAGSCSEETLSDPIACRPCTPVDSCFNECDECELCAGRPQPDPSCATPDENPCGDGYQACGQPGQSDCPGGAYCITGCCITIVK